MKYLSLLPLAGLAMAAPPAWEDSKPTPVSGGESCDAAVTGKAALGDDNIRKQHCSSFLHTIVTPPAVTVTSTVTGKPGKDHPKRAEVTVCPNDVPNYASACDEAGYSAACSKFGVIGGKTETIPATTTTVFVWVGPTGGAGKPGHGGPGGPGGDDECDAVTVTVTKDGSGSGPTGKPGHGGPGGDDDEDKTVTVTVTKDGAHPTGKPGHGGPGGDDDDEDKTVTVTVTKDGAHPTGKPGDEDKTVTVTETKTVTKDGDKPSGPTDVPDVPVKGCLTDKEAKTIVDGFRDLLEFTSYNGTQGAPGRGYHYNVSAATLASDFSDISDSINFMAGFKLGSVTFPSKAAFDYGQGVLQPEVITETLNIFHDCKSITWRWKLTPKIPGAFPIVGINYMIINDEKKIQKNYAEFDNGAWLQSFGKQCANTPPTVVEGDFAKRAISA